MADAFGQRGLVRGYVCCFDVFGQPGTWQDATCLVGVERMIMETYDDPAWVHELLGILFRRKQVFVESLGGRPVRYSGTGRRERVVDGHLAADFRRVRGPLRPPVDRVGPAAPASGSPTTPAAA